METKRNPQDSMKSTWRLGNRDDWTPFHWLIELSNAYPVSLDTEVPKHSKQEKIPYLPQWSVHLWVLFFAAIPLVIHQTYLSITGLNLGYFAAFQLYFWAFNITVIHEIRIIRRLGHAYGFLDGDKHERDGIPDVGVVRVVTSIFKTTGTRMILSLYLCYNSSEAPVSMNWLWLPLEIGLYNVVLDFWFYWYHRLMHDVDFLWKYHRKHHLSKHPNPLLTAYADHEQELFDMVGIPLLTYFSLKAIGLPMGFYEWWICHQYIIFTEVIGHSGLRIHVTSISTLNWLLQFLNVELVIEDHDLHHRKGWRKSYNYGKQTRLWDRIFGTCHDRIESVEGNIDYVNTITIPLV